MTKMMRVGSAARISSAARRPSAGGISRSSTAMSGRCSRASRTASVEVAASATTPRSASSSSRAARAPEEIFVVGEQEPDHAGPMPSGLALAHRQRP